MQKLDISRFHGRASAKRIGVFLVFLVLLTSVFWRASRYPQLDEKQMMGDRSAISALAFDPIIVTTADDGLGMRIFAGTVNWYNTNWKGMTFGLLLAGTFLSILVLLSVRSSRSIFLNTLAGMAIGAPMGVCTNCVAPISKSLDDGGSRLETTLATLFSSPTLNIIVVTMLFTMFPLPIALLKMGLTLVLIMVAVPLLTRFAFTRENEDKEVGAVSCTLAGPPVVESWPRAFKGAAVIWGQCFWFIIKTAVPLMLLAGLLGTVAFELIPVNALSSLEFNWWGAILIAALGTFLPVPIAFDVILASVLMGAGLHVGYVMILLFTLGPFSIYPFLLLWRSISPRVVTLAYVTVMVLGVVGGSTIYAHSLLQRSRLFSVVGDPTRDTTNRDICVGDAADCSEAADGRALLNDVPALLGAVRRCDEAGSESDHRTCLVEKVRAITTHLATTGAEPERLAPPLSRVSIGLASQCRDDACGDALALFRAHYTQDPRECDTLSEPDLAEYCTSNVNRWAAKQSGDLGNCLSGSVDDRALCAASVSGPSVTERIEACARVGTEADAERCEVLLLRRTDVLDHPEVCSAFASAGGREQCPIAVDRPRSKRTAKDLLIRVARWIFPPNTELGSLSALDALMTQPDPFLNVELSEEPSADIPEQAYGEQAGISITFAEFLPPTDPAHASAGTETETLFRSVPVEAVGIDPPLSFWPTGTAAAGDYDADGWLDLVISDADGLSLYRNLGSLQFTRAPLSYDPAYVFPNGVVGFVDIDNDGDLDIVQTAKSDLIFLLNQDGAFADAPVLSLGFLESDPVATPFADVDRDGLLDVFLAFYESGVSNVLLLNKQLSFEPSPAYHDRYQGQTYGLLFSDVNSDGYTDLFVGNDFDKSDELFFGAEGGSLTGITASSGVFAGVSTFNMGYDSGDINNDLKLDIFSTEALMVEGVEPEEECSDPSWTADFRTMCTEYWEKYRPILRGGDIRRCQELTVAPWRRDCALEQVGRIARLTRDPSVCDALPASPDYFRQSCRSASVPRTTAAGPPHLENELPQFHRNALHVQLPDGTFAESARAYGVAESYWAWNARIHDYDNDGWQDIFVVNGRVGVESFATDQTPSVFFKNMEGVAFEDRAEQYGLKDLLLAKSYLAEDFDLDGDIDILAQAIYAPFVLYVNGTSGRSETNAVEVRVVDHRMNRFGIGTQIVIHHDGGAQLREIKSSGGFQSHNAPMVHFGLGAVTAVDRIEVRWTDGERTVLEGDFTANRRYTIERKAQE